MQGQVRAQYTVSTYADNDPCSPSLLGVSLQVLLTFSLEGNLTFLWDSASQAPSQVVAAVFSPISLTGCAWKEVGVPLAPQETTPPPLTCSFPLCCPVSLIAAFIPLQFFTICSCQPLQYHFCPILGASSAHVDDLSNTLTSQG